MDIYSRVSRWAGIIVRLLSFFLTHSPEVDPVGWLPTFTSVHYLESGFGNDRLSSGAHTRRAPFFGIHERASDSGWFTTVQVCLYRRGRLEFALVVVSPRSGCYLALSR
jgi:hypothetical protein